MKKILRHIVAFLAWLVVGVIVLLVIVLVAIQIPVVKTQIVRIAEKELNKQLYATLSIGNLSDNFFTGIRLDDVLLKTLDNRDTIAYISSVQLKYRLYPLLQGKIVVDNAVLENPYVYLEQLPDSTWNFQHIVKPPEEPDTTTTPFNMQVLVERFRLNNGLVHINTPNGQIPKQVRDLFIDLSGSYATDKQEVDLKEFRLATFEPDYVVKKLMVRGAADKEKIDLYELVLQTSRNGITSIGTYFFSGDKESTLHLQTDPIVLDEFRQFIPESFTLKAKPTVAIDITRKGEHLETDIHCKDVKQGFDLHLLSDYLIEYLADSTAVVTYDLALDVDKVDLAYWLDDATLKYIISGNLIAKGHGLDPHTMQSSVKGDFGDIVLYGNRVQKLNLLLNYLAGNVNGNVNARGGFGSLKIKPDVRRIFEKNPSYNVLMNARKLNLAAFMGKKYESDIDMDAWVKGTGFDFNRMNAESSIQMSPSQVMGIMVDTVDSKIDLLAQNFLINSFFIKALSAEVQATGNYSLKGNSDFTALIDLYSVDEIKRFVQIEDLQTQAKLKAHLTGHPDSLMADVDLNVGKTIYGTMMLDSLLANFTGQLTHKKDIVVDGNLLAANFNTGSLLVDTIKLKAISDTKNTTLELNVKNKDIQADLAGMVALGETINVTLSDLLLGYKNYNWKLAKDTAYINVGTDEYQIKNFHLLSDNADTLQSILLDGKVSRVAEQDLNVDITNISIPKLMSLFSLEQKIVGDVSLHARLQGTPQSPELKATLGVDDLAFEDYKFSNFTSELALQNNEMEMKLDATPVDIGKISGNVKLPMRVRLDSMQFDVVPKKTDPFNLDLLIDKIPLSIIKLFIPADEASGYVNSEIIADGTIGKPNITGGLHLKDGKFGIKKYGVAYHNMQIAIDVANNSLTVDTFLIQSKDGNMRGQGTIRSQEELYKAQLGNSNVAFKFNKFNPVNHKYYNMQLSGNLDLKTEQDSILFSGNLTIPETEVYLPALLNLMGASSNADVPKPLLVQELEKIQTASADSAVYRFTPDSLKSIKKRFDLLSNLQGVLNVKIPRNMWIKNDDMRLELSGDIEIVKHKEFFELFGTIDVVRGQYSLLGKTFIIDAGTVTFQGGEKLDPVLAIEATYTLRDSERNRRYLVVDITGTLSEPVLKFTYDDADISEGDAVAYLLFGKSLDELASGQSAGGGMNAADVAQSLAASLVSSQLTKILGNAFNVDYIEFRTGSSFETASFVVGKYITDKLFVSYTQNIGQIEDDDVARYEMTMEYELFKFLFLQLTSSSITNGFDMIFKVNSK